MKYKGSLNKYVTEKNKLNKYKTYCVKENDEISVLYISFLTV